MPSRANRRRISAAQRRKVDRVTRQPRFEVLEDRALLTVGLITDQPTIALVTDRPDYALGEVATFTLSGIDYEENDPAETVQFQVLHADETPNVGEDHEPWLVTDGDTASPYLDHLDVWHLPDLDGIRDGNVSTQWTVSGEDSVGSTLQAIATLSSGAAAVAMFTDSVTLSFLTSQSPFPGGSLNQGWWSPNASNSNSNTNYSVGRSGGSSLHHNFFTFDLSSLNFAGATLQSATLRVVRAVGIGHPTETVGFFDVSTPAAALNANDGTSSAIYNDLGSGNNYGTFVLSTEGNASEVLSFPLNTLALTDISAAAGGFFSIGGALLSDSGLLPQEFLFGFSGSAAAQLVLVVEPVARYDFIAPSFAANEGNSTNTTSLVAVTRSGNISVGSSVDVVLSGLSATAGSDFTSGPITINFAPGQTTQLVPIALLGDTTVELDETIQLSFANFSGSGKAGTIHPTAILNLVNDDSATLSIRDVSQSETDGLTTFSFVTSLSNPVDTTVSVTVNTADDTALAMIGGPGTADYQAISGGTVNFAPGTTSQPIVVIVEGDDLVELDETFFVNLSDLSAEGRAVSVGDSQGQGTIQNDDFAPVADANGPYTIDEGDGLMLDGSISSDADSSTLTYQWDVDGDGDFDESVTGVMPTLSAPQMAALGLNDGPDTRIVTVVVRDGTNSDTASATLTINNVAPVIDNVLATSADENGIVTLTGTYHDVGTRDTHTIDINWGQGEMPSLGVVVTGGTFSISHQYLDDNPTGTSSDIYAISVTLTDDDTASDSDTTTTTVANEAPVVDSLTVSSAVINEDGSVTITGSFTDVGIQDTHTLMIDWGTGETPSAAMVTQGAGSGTFSATHHYLDDNPTGTLSDVYTITATVTDDDGSSSSATVDVTVNNVAPSVGIITAPVAPNAAGIVIHASASFTDQGTADTHTAIWNWGDGNTSAGVVSGSGDSGSVTGSHAYDSAGVYTVTLTVTDDDGSSGQSVFQYVVVYDPSAGFVTGGGWIISPVGAYVPDATLTGKATFGFVSKSHTGSNIPTGQTQFQFKSGNLNFHSTSYERLVVAGARAQYNGVGKINGAGNYGFMLTSIDGQASGGGGVDKFRIKIWDKNNNDAVVYDNQIGGIDDASPTTVLGGGQIVIHTNGSNLSGTSIGTTLNGAMLTQPMLESAVAEAISHWSAAGVSQQHLAEISQFDIGLAKFSGAKLGLASSSTNKIWLDVDAAGLGWSTNLNGGGYDLVSAVSHEIGHALGFDHDVMGELLEPGEIHLSGDYFEAVGELPGLHQHFGRAFSALDSVFDGVGSSGRGLRSQWRPTNVRNDFSVSYNEQNVDRLLNDFSFAFDSLFGRDDVRDEDVESPGDVSDEPLGAKSKGSTGVANAARSRRIAYRS